MANFVCVKPLRMPPQGPLSYSPQCLSNLHYCPQAKCLAPPSLLPDKWPFYLALEKLSKLYPLTLLPKHLSGWIFIPPRSVKKPPFLPKRKTSPFSQLPVCPVFQNAVLFPSSLFSAHKLSCLWHLACWVPLQLPSYHLFQCKAFGKKASFCWKPFPVTQLAKHNFGVASSSSSHSLTPPHPTHTLWCQSSVSSSPNSELYATIAGVSITLSSFIFFGGVGYRGIAIFIFLLFEALSLPPPLNDLVSFHSGSH